MEQLTAALLTQVTRRNVKVLADAHPSTPIEVVEGSKSPTLEGERAHYTTQAGSRVWSPSAYRKRCFKPLIRVCSTLRVEVGVDWLVSVSRAGTLEPV